ncbi:VOC family protein [Shewanella sp. SNU WT4]|uniref:VOC family protein n=1 Tax=Shewanella sp. SNU WT4 TaxID=2590015 RepID=UPI001F113753|nr:VOC family protein [Shewanella sp. SNU WT4]
MIMDNSNICHGMPCWSELAAKDWTQAKQFYHAFFGWKMDDMPLPVGAYTMLSLQGTAIGALYPAEDDPCTPMLGWSTYFAVDDIHASLQAVQASGGVVRLGPHQVGSAGFMAQVADPEGAVFCLWQAKDHSGAVQGGGCHHLSWVELACKDADSCQHFYQQVLGWQCRTLMVNRQLYRAFSVSGKPVAGMLQMTSDWGDMPSHWMLYFQVADCDDSAAKATSLGATVCVSPTEIAKIGRFSVINDPQGATFSIVALDDKRLAQQ